MLGQVTAGEQQIIDMLKLLHASMMTMNTHLANLSLQVGSSGGSGMSVTEMSRAVELGIQNFRGSRNGGAGW